MKVLLIEDEKLAAERLKKLILSYDSSIEFVPSIDSVKEAISYFDSGAVVDLIFMDIQIADGLSFEIFDKCQVKFPVIFTTAYNEYALRAFKVNSIDYLLKPISFQELKFSLDKFRDLKNHFRHISKDSAEEIREMIVHENKQRFVVRSGTHIQTINAANIASFYSKESITFLHTCDNKKYPIDYSLEEIDSFISPKNFFRISRKYIINIDSIEDIIPYPSSRLKVKLKNVNQEDIIVSREKVSAFKSWLDK